MPKGNREFGKSEANFPGLRLSDKDKLSAGMDPKYGGGKSLMDLQMQNGQDTEDDLRPSMQQDWHPDHNMPAPEHDGTTLGTGDYISKLKETNASNYSIQSGK